jgi:hypothetical protein
VQEFTFPGYVITPNCHPVQEQLQMRLFTDMDKLLQTGQNMAFMMDAGSAMSKLKGRVPASHAAQMLLTA